MKSQWLILAALNAFIATAEDIPQTLYIPGGTFEMGDHHNLGGGEHRNDELPLRTVTVKPFWAGKFEVTVAQYCDFLNSAEVTVRNGLVYQGNSLLCDTYGSSKYSRIGFDGKTFSVLEKKNHPITGVRWEGAAAYCNWLSAQQNLEPCYSKDWKCDRTKNGYRLPSEEEWEYAGRGGLYNPYAVFPWGDDTDPARANWPNSGDPYETGDEPFTTPVGFYDGSLRQKEVYHWTAPQVSYQTKNGMNNFGLYDMAGNAWEWCNDLYSDSSADPDIGKPMPDGKIYHSLRGGSWFNGEWGHSRVSNRNPGYFRGPLDPDHPYYHIGLRVVRNAADVPLVAGELKVLGDQFKFTEGPAADEKGNVYFSDIPAGRIYVFSTDGKLAVFREDSGGSNGLFFDRDGNLVACEGAQGRLTSTAPDGKVSVLADEYDGKGFNKLNDLWIDPQGGIYFTDPIYGKAVKKQDGEHVYYLLPDRSKVIRVIDDYVRPNGLIGTPDGKTLYVADFGAAKIWRYAINADGTLSGKTLFAEVVGDGMTMDAAGNLYVAEKAVLIFSPEGKLLETIKTPTQPANVSFGGKDHRTLFITARTCLYSIPMNVPGTVRSFSDVWTRSAAREAFVSPKATTGGSGNNPPAAQKTERGDAKRQKGGSNRPPRAEAQKQVLNDPGAGLLKDSASFVLSSSEVKDGGTLPTEYTGDGAASTLPLEWKGAPEGTKSFAVIMHHMAPDGIKWYWILYNIPPEVQSLPKNVKGVGTTGGNSVNNRAGYAPPMSKGPGEKTYIYTVYALSETLKIDSSQNRVDRETLLAAMEGHILATAELHVVYSRPAGAVTDHRGDNKDRKRKEGQP